MSNQAFDRLVEVEAELDRAQQEQDELRRALQRIVGLAGASEVRQDVRFQRAISIARAALSRDRPDPEPEGQDEDWDTAPDGSGISHAVKRKDPHG